MTTKDKLRILNLVLDDLNKAIAHHPTLIAITARSKTAVFDTVDEAIELRHPLGLCILIAVHTCGVFYFRTADACELIQIVKTVNKCNDSENFWIHDNAFYKQLTISSKKWYGPRIKWIENTIDFLEKQTD